MEFEKLPNREFSATPIDLLVVLGKNLGVGSTRDDIRRDPKHLSADSRINLVAAGLLYQPGIKILLSGGQTAGKDIPSQPQSAFNFLRERFPDIPVDDIYIDETGIDTARTAQTVAEYYSGQFRNIALVTVGYHRNNAKKLFANWGVKLAATYDAEEIVSRGLGLESYILAWKGLTRVKLERLKENLIRSPLLIVDRRSIILDQLAAYFRSK
jgi:hypothetical protein